MAGKYVAVPVDMAEANALVRRWHRRHGGVQGYKLALAAVLVAERRLCGVVVLGRPLSRGLDDGWTLEVLRLAGDGTPDVCSFLYGAAARAGKAAGYPRLVTYTLASEAGISLRAAGWQPVSAVHGRSWSCPARPRPDAVKGKAKVRWERVMGQVPAEPRKRWLGLEQPSGQGSLETLWSAAA